jgi:ABC-type multidrug transport system permease subunit
MHAFGSLFHPPTAEGNVAINTGKVVLGGLAGGVVITVLDLVINGLILAEQNAAALAALNPALAENLETGAPLAGFIVIDLLFGILLVWTYAAMRPRFGPGPRTAALAGVQIWLVALLVYGAMTFMGIWTWGYLITGAIASLVMVIIGGTVGARFYTEA